MKKTRIYANETLADSVADLHVSNCELSVGGVTLRRPRNCRFDASRNVGIERTMPFIPLLIPGENSREHGN